MSIAAPNRREARQSPESISDSQLWGLIRRVATTTYPSGYYSVGESDLIRGVGTQFSFASKVHSENTFRATWSDGGPALIRVTYSELGPYSKAGLSIYRGDVSSELELTWNGNQNGDAEGNPLADQVDCNKMDVFESGYGRMPIARPDLYATYLYGVLNTVDETLPATPTSAPVNASA